MSPTPARAGLNKYVSDNMNNAEHNGYRSSVRDVMRGVLCLTKPLCRILGKKRTV